ncbi:hypothetical protein L6Q96_01365 [Candidatus Binatia bacterium]|nr:hypothetical protein [Candidatus Binatia bacterium]
MQDQLVAGALCSPRRCAGQQPDVLLRLRRFPSAMTRRKRIEARTSGPLRIAALAALGALVVLDAAPAAASTQLDAALACRKALSTAGRVYADKRRKSLLTCGAKLLKCDILLEVDGENANGCRSKATDSCKRAIGPSADSAVNKAADKFDTKSGTECLPFGLTDMLSTAAGGLWFGNDTTCNLAVDLPSFIDCLRGEIDVEVDTVVGHVMPRIGILLDNAGLGGPYPNLPRPPSTLVIVSATAPGSGTLVSPGTISISSGMAVQIEGDAATLPCGGGQNGKLTISVSTALDPCTDPAALTYQIKEPYGSGDAVTLGPFTVDYNYCIDLKDASCSDTVTGTIDVP